MRHTQRFTHEKPVIRDTSFLVTQTSSPLSQQMAEIVRVELARKRIPQGALAEALQLSQATVSRRLSGVAPFELDEIPVVAQVLGVSVADLLNEVAA